MSVRIRFLLVSGALLVSLPARAVSTRDIAEIRMIAPQIVARDTEFDYCLKDPNNASVLRFNSSTGAYAACGSDGTFEQGVGVVTTQSNGITLSHTFQNPALNGLESIHATVNPATGLGQATLYGSKEGVGKFARFVINDPNVHDASDCTTCPSRSAVTEGVIDSFIVPTSSIGFNSNPPTEVTFLQSYSLNTDFSGRISTLTAGIGRNGAGALSFQFVIYSDDHGEPGSPLYVGPLLHYTDFPALPTIGVVRQDIGLDTGPSFHVGVRWNPKTDPLYVPFGTNADAPLSKVFFCEPGQSSCDLITSISQFSQLRGLYFSLDYEYPGVHASGGLVRYQIGQPIDMISYKCDGSYDLIQTIKNYGLSRLYAENESNEFFPSAYSNAFARTNLISTSDGTGLDGPAESSYAGMRYKALSYVTNHGLDYCTRPDDATDFVCHELAGYQPDTCGYTRIVGVKSGFELSCANAPADWIDRWFISYNGSSWQSQALNPVKGSPSIGSPEFGFNWYAAAGWKLGVAYEYKLTSGLIQTQLTQGNSVIGTYSIDTDDPPAGFNPDLASRMAGDCTRDGLCIFGRFDLHTKTNVADVIDFRETPPEIKSWVLGSSPSGLDFGRAVNINGRDGTALYGSYTPSPVANQFRLQIDYIDLKAYRKFTLGFDYAAGAGSYPITLSRAGGEWGLGLSKGVDLFYSFTAGCQPARVGGHSSGNDSGAPHPGFPCQNIPLVQRF